MRIGPFACIVAAWTACALGTLWLPAPARAQSGAEAAPIVSVHPDMATRVQLPDEIEGVRSADNHDIMVAGVGSVLYLRPRPDTPAGVEVFIEVKTRTLHRFFLVRVVEHAEDATERLVVPAPASGLALDAPPMMPTPPEPPAHPPDPEREPVSASAERAPDTPRPATAPAKTKPAIAATTGRAAEAARGPRFELSVHAVAALAGTTELRVPGYALKDVRQPHRAFGLRVAGGLRDAPWTVEANVSGEWPAAPTSHRGTVESIAVSGPWLRVDMGMRARLRMRWSPTLYAGLGWQAHHRNIENGNDTVPAARTLPRVGVLVLGLGMTYQVGDLLLGLELHMRQGVPAEYHSVEGLLSVGFFLDQGE